MVEGAMGTDGNAVPTGNALFRATRPQDGVSIRVGLEQRIGANFAADAVTPADFLVDGDQVHGSSWYTWNAFNANVSVAE
jgi:hypothetical protein